MSADRSWRSTVVRVLVVGVVAVAVAACSADDPDVDRASAASDGTAPSVTDQSATSAAPGSSIGVVTDPTEPPVDPVRVGLVAPSAPDDASFTQSMIDSLDHLASDHELDLSVVSDAPRADQALEAGASLVADGADLVIFHGSQYRSAVEQLATDHPDITFAWGTAANTTELPNVVGYTARADEGGYVNGVIAAGLTDSGVVGVVGPVQVGDAGMYVDGFVLGASAADPGVEVSVNFIESYTDAALAAEAATVMSDFGADVLTGTSQIIAGPIDIALRRGLPWLGTQSDPSALAPDQVVASQVYHWEVAMAGLLDDVRDGAASGDLAPLTLANGGLVIEFNEAFALPESVRSAADETIAGLVDGSIATGVS